MKINEQKKLVAEIKEAITDLQIAKLTAECFEPEKVRYYDSIIAEMKSRLIDLNAWKKNRIVEANQNVLNCLKALLIWANIPDGSKDEFLRDQCKLAIKRAEELK